MRPAIRPGDPDERQVDIGTQGLAKFQMEHGEPLQQSQSDSLVPESQETRLRSRPLTDADRRWPVKPRSGVENAERQDRGKHSGGGREWAAD
jgi:hypothetical protein